MSSLLDAITYIRRTPGKGAKLLRLRKETEKRIFRQTYDSQALRALLYKSGVTPGRCVFVQSSWNEFYNYTGTPIELISVLLDMIGPRGTLVMPANPLPLRKKVDIVDFRTVPSQAGLITELFRRQSGVTRSIHMSSSVCAYGPEATFLTRDHHTTETPWDLDSPFGRLRDLDALQLSLGLSPFWATPLHVVDAILRHEIEFYRRLFRTVATYHWKDLEGREGIHSYFLRGGRVQAWRLKWFYDSSRFTWQRLSNLRVFAIDVPYLIEHGLYLARKGINHYLSPVATPWTLRTIEGKQ